MRQQLDSSGPIESGLTGGLEPPARQLVTAAEGLTQTTRVPRGPGPVSRAEIVGLPAMELLPFAISMLAQKRMGARIGVVREPQVPTGASVVSIAILNSSGFSMTTVSPAGSPVAASSNLTVTVITGCPGDSRRLRAMDG